MKIREFEELVADRRRRMSRQVEDYDAMVNGYFGLVGGFYQKDWGESHHFPVYTGQSNRKEAMRATEQSLADTGGFRPGMRVLDVGCGIGGPAMTIAGHSGAHVTGVDLVDHRVAAAQATAARRGLAELTDFQHGDALRLPFEDATFDAAYSFEALCHVPDKAAAYREVARVLKPGGAFLGYDWLRGAGLTAEGQGYVEEICRCHGVPYLNTLEGTRADLAAAGFEVTTVCDAAACGDIAPNWPDLRRSMARARLLPRLLTPRVVRMMLRGGKALCDAAETGAFLIGFWHVRAPHGS